MSLIDQIKEASQSITLPKDSLFLGELYPLSIAAHHSPFGVAFVLIANWESKDEKPHEFFKLTMGLLSWYGSYSYDEQSHRLFVNGQEISANTNAIDVLGQPNVVLKEDGKGLDLIGDFYAVEAFSLQVMYEYNGKYIGVDPFDRMIHWVLRFNFDYGHGIIRFFEHQYRNLSVMVNGFIQKGYVFTLTTKGVLTIAKNTGEIIKFIHGNNLLSVNRVSGEVTLNHDQEVMVFSDLAALMDVNV